MATMNDRLCFSAVLAALLVVAGVLLLAVSTGAERGDPADELENGYFTMVDEGGKEIVLTARILAPGDVFITEKNDAYEVERVDGSTAYARFVERVALDAESNGKKAKESSGMVTGLLDIAALQESQSRRVSRDQPIAIYHTHSDESYVPTSGTASKEWGDVYKVGEAFAAALREKGIKAIQSKANHNPHDGGAYHRSRATASELIRDNPAFVFDVHRDAVPARVYMGEVGGVPISKITLIVGRQNQNRDANLTWAKRLKAEADRMHPGLIRGILWAGGNYNQDLAPRSVLMEIGAHTTSLDRAQNAARLLADVVPKVAYAGAATTAGGPGGTVGRSLLWILGIGAVVAAVFLVMNEGSLKGIGKRIGHFVGAEMAGYLGAEEPSKGSEGQSASQPPQKPAPDGPSDGSTGHDGPSGTHKPETGTR